MQDPCYLVLVDLRPTPHLQPPNAARRRLYHASSREEDENILHNGPRLLGRAYASEAH